MRDSAQGSLVLMVGQIVTTLISAITVIWMARFLGSTAYGQYTIALFPVSIALLFQDLGMNASLTRFCAKYRYEEQYEKLKSVILTGLIFSIVTSLIISGLMFILAEPIASLYLKRPEIEPLVKASALAVLGGGGLLTTIQAILVGYEMMRLRSLTQIFWSSIRTLFSVVLLLVGLGAFGAVLANTASQVVAGLVSLLLLYVSIKFEKGKGGFDWGMLKTFLSYGLPLSMSSLIWGILNQIYNYVMVLYVATDLIGNYGAANSFGVLLSFLAVPIATSLFPLYSKFKKDDLRLTMIFQMSVKYTTIVTLPVVLVIIVLASPLSRLIYGINDYPYVPVYLSILVLDYAWEGLGGISLDNLISGVGESKVTLKANIFTFFTGIILVLILVPRYQMIGLLFAVVFAYRGGWLYEILWVKKELGISIDWLSTTKIYAAAFVAFVFAYLVVNVPSLQGWVALVSGVLTYFIIYLITLPSIGALKREDIKQLSTTVEILGPLRGVVRRILALIYGLARN